MATINKGQSQHFNFLFIYILLFCALDIVKINKYFIIKILLVHIIKHMCDIHID